MKTKVKSSGLRVVSITENCYHLSVNDLQKLEEIFAHFPGIGPRQARRFAYYILGKPPAFIKEFTQLIENVKRHVHECDSCHRLFIENSARRPVCNICGDGARDRSVLMIVSRDSDLESVEKSGAYRGIYFVLGGTVPILDKEPDKRIRLKPLLEDISKSKLLKEVILSLNATPDGEHTANIVKEAIGKIAPANKIKVTILGRGLSTGSELEYADGDTIRQALRHRE